MRAASTLFVIGTALSLAAPSAHALGFGRISNLTQLGQPLNFAAAVRLEADETLSRECVSAEVQSGDSKLQPGQLRVTLEGRADSLDRNVRVTSSTLIDEPVVSVTVTLGCNARVTRKFVAFIDPPAVDAAQTAAADSLLPQRIDSQVAPIVTAVQGEGDGGSSIGRRVARGGGGRDRDRSPSNRNIDRDRSRPAAAPSVAVANEAAAAPRADKPRRLAANTRQPSVARQAPSGSRLQLEAAAPIVARSAVAADAGASAVISAATSASAPPAGDALAAALAKERQRLARLEEDFAKMRADSQATQGALAAVQARLKASESERYANPLVYALAWLSGLLVLAVVALWWRQSRMGVSGPWWSGPATGAAAAASEPGIRSVSHKSRADADAEAAGKADAEAEVSAPASLGSPRTAAGAFSVSTLIDDEPQTPAEPTRPSPFVSSGLGSSVRGSSMLASSGPGSSMRPIAAQPADEAPRELSVEELIDLEQQVEFFIVLGQDEAAIELLMSHVRSDGGISPLPYLKLLEIYRRRGEREAYQRIRERFNRRFNSYAPDWDSDLQQGRALAEYPDTIARLQQLWTSPARAMETLDASLFRRNKTDDTFDLPAYRELLFLYAVARDLAEHAGALSAAHVDLLLPIGEPGEEPISRLTATTQSGDFQASDMMTMPLDLDVSFDPAAAQEVPTVPSALRRTAGPMFSEHSGPANLIDFDLDEPVRLPKVGGGNR